MRQGGNSDGTGLRCVRAWASPPLGPGVTVRSKQRWLLLGYTRTRVCGETEEPCASVAVTLNPGKLSTLMLGGLRGAE